MRALTQQAQPSTPCAPRVSKEWRTASAALHKGAAWRTLVPGLGCPLAPLRVRCGVPLTSARHGMRRPSSAAVRVHAEKLDYRPPPPPLPLRIGDAYAFHGIWHALLAYLCWKHAAADPWRKRGHLAMREHCLVVAALCALFGMNYLRMARHQGHGAFGPGAASAGAVCTLGTAALFASLALALYMTA